MDRSFVGVANGHRNRLSRNASTCSPALGNTSIREENRLGSGSRRHGKRGKTTGESRDIRRCRSRATRWGRAARHGATAGKRKRSTAPMDSVCCAARSESRSWAKRTGRPDPSHRPLETNSCPDCWYPSALPPWGIHHRPQQRSSHEAVLWLTPQHHRNSPSEEASTTCRCCVQTKWRGATRCRNKRFEDRGDRIPSHCPSCWYCWHPLYTLEQREDRYEGSTVGKARGLDLTIRIDSSDAYSMYFLKR